VAVSPRSIDALPAQPPEDSLLPHRLPQPVCQARARDQQRVQSGMALTRDARTALEAAGTANVRDKLRYAGPGRGAAVPGFASGDITRGDIEDWLTGKERKEKNELRRRANLGIAISLFSMAVGLAGLLVALLK
jgi:hypothetical protein